MKRPSFQFYVADWRLDQKLRRCSPAARGVWIDILCLLHDSDEQYGVLRWPLEEIANAAGASMQHVRELVSKGVLRGSDEALAEPVTYAPRSGRKVGPEVTLLAPQAGPIWYSKRLIKDEYVRTIRGEGTRFGDEDGDGFGEGQTPRKPRAPKPAPKPRQGDGPTSASATAVGSTEDVPPTPPAPAPEPPPPGEPEDPPPPDDEPPPEPPDDDPPPEPPPEPVTPTAAGIACRAMRRAGLTAANPSDPRLHALLEVGVTPDELAAIAAEAVTKGKGSAWSWVLAVAKARRDEAGQIAATTAAAPPDPMAWRKTFEGVQRRAAELGVKPRTGEMAADFERRVLTAHQRAASAAQGAPA